MKQKFKILAGSASAGVTALMTAASVFAGNTQNFGNTTNTGDGPGVIVKPDGFATSLSGVISFALNLVMIVALLLVFLYLILGGIQWITSGGDKGKTEEARNKITAAVIGIIILAAAYALVQFVAYILGVGDFNNILTNVGQLNTQ